MSTQRTRNWMRTAGVLLGLVLAMLAVVLAIRSMLQDAGKPRNQSIQQIAILKPPLPPPPPKPETKPPEVKKEEVKIPDPPKPQEAAKADEPPPAGERLGVDAAGAAGSDGFGLEARKGGRDLLTLGQGGTGTRSEYAWFAGRLQRHIQDELGRHAELRNSDYRVVVRLWLDRSGRIQRVELVDTTGTAQIDGAIQKALTGATASTEAPPEGMPQPVRIRITSRATG